MPNRIDPLVNIIVLHWKNYRSTQLALTSIKKLTYLNYKVILVVNFSNDGCVERLEIEFPDVHVLRNSQNLGFSRGCNKGILYACQQGVEYILLANNDVELEPGSLTAAVAAAEHDLSVG